MEVVIETTVVALEGALVDGASEGVVVAATEGVVVAGTVVGTVGGGEVRSAEKKKF